MRESFPERDHLVLILTHKCNKICKYCPVKKQNKSMDRDTALRAVDLFLGFCGNEKNIKFFGGEPLLAWKLIKEIVLYASEKVKDYGKNINFTLTTNGILLTKQILCFIKKKKISLVISIDDLKDKNKLLENNEHIDLAEIKINFFIPPPLINDIYKNFTELFKLGFRKFNLLPAYYVKWAPKQMNILKNELKKIAAFYLSSKSNIYIQNIDTVDKAPLFNTYLTVDCNGDIFSSDSIVMEKLNKFREEMKIGDVNKGITPKEINFDSLLNKAIAKEILKSTYKVDSVLSEFVDCIKREIKNNTERIDIKTGFFCNNYCSFCVQGDKRNIHGDKTTSLIKKELSEAVKACRSIVFTGGEPTVRKDFLELIKYARNLGFKQIQAQTNGRMFAYKKFVEDVIKAGVTEFAIALHGHSAYLHDFLTAATGSFEQTVQGIKNLKTLSQRVVTNTVITKSNYLNLPEIASFLISLGVGQYQFAFVHALGTAAENFDSIVPRMSIIEPYVKRGLDIGIKAGKKVMTEAVPYCFMGGYEDYIAEKIIPITKIYDFNSVVENFSIVRQKEGKLKSINCKKCKYYQLCEGPWREYPEHFGWSEFIPVY